MKRRGFTLIELLVVIAIIAILAAILFPVFLTAKERGRQAMCCSNLKQLTMAFFGYADDHDGFLPIGSRRHFSLHGQLSEADDIEWSGTQWYSLDNNETFPPIDVREGSLYKGGYARTVGVYQCPTDAELPSYRPDGSKAMGPPSTTGGFGLSYSLNCQLGLKSASGGYTTVKLSAAVAGRTGQVLFLIHETRGNSNHYGINDGYFSWGPSWKDGGDFFDTIHYNGTTCSFADGHVKWISNGEMQRCEDATPSPWYRNSWYYNYGTDPDGKRDPAYAD